MTSYLTSAAALISTSLEWVACERRVLGERIEADDATLDGWPQDGSPERAEALLGLANARTLRREVADIEMALEGLRARLRLARITHDALPPSAAEIRNERRDAA